MPHEGLGYEFFFGEKRIGKRISRIKKFVTCRTGKISEQGFASFFTTSPMNAPASHVERPWSMEHPLGWLVLAGMGVPVLQHTHGVCSHHARPRGCTCPARLPQRSLRLQRVTVTIVVPWGGFGECQLGPRIQTTSARTKQLATMHGRGVFLGTEANSEGTGPKGHVCKLIA